MSGDEEATYGGGEANGTANTASAASAANDKIYEPKSKKTMIRVLTVMAYVFSVSLAAIMLSAYYIFLWNPKVPDRDMRPQRLEDHQPF